MISVDDDLRSFVLKYGVGFAKNPNICDAFLSDLLPSNPDLRKLLVLGAVVDIPANILVGKTLHFSPKFQKIFSSRKEWNWVVGAWQYALTGKKRSFFQFIPSWGFMLIALIAILGIAIAIFMQLLPVAGEKNIVLVPEEKNTMTEDVASLNAKEHELLIKESTLNAEKLIHAQSLIVEREQSILALKALQKVSNDHYYLKKQQAVMQQLHKLNLDLDRLAEDYFQSLIKVCYLDEVKSTNVSRQNHSDAEVNPKEGLAYQMSFKHIKQCQAWRMGDGEQWDIERVRADIKLILNDLSSQ